MGKSLKYTKEQLYGSTKTIRRQCLNKANKGLAEDASISKTQAFKLIANKLGLASDRSLWKNSDYPYLDGWYTKLKSDVEAILEQSKGSGFSLSSVSDELISSDEKQNYLEIISALESRIKKLSLENLRLRQNNKII